MICVHANMTVTRIWLLHYAQEALRTKNIVNGFSGTGSTLIRSLFSIETWNWIEKKSLIGKVILTQKILFLYFYSSLALTIFKQIVMTIYIGYSSNGGLLWGHSLAAKQQCVTECCGEPRGCVIREQFTIGWLAERRITGCGAAVRTVTRTHSYTWTIAGDMSGHGFQWRRW